MKYFKRKEFQCQCGCGFNTIDYELAEVLDSIRLHYNSPIKITSGCRCRKHNKHENGSKTSKHLIGQAVDFKVKGVNSNDVYSYLCETYPNKYGIGKYNGRTHIDIRSQKARWIA